jgi:hypothetical protein
MTAALIFIRRKGLIIGQGGYLIMKKDLEHATSVIVAGTRQFAGR